MNIQPGGEFRSIGFRHSEETTKKMSKIQKTIQNDPTIKAKKRNYRDWETDRKSTRLNSSHRSLSRMPSSA